MLRRARNSLIDPGTDVVTITPPERLPWVEEFHMRSHGGRDQIVGAVSTHGWDAFEYPMPDVFAAALRSTRGVVVDVGANTGYYSLLASCAARRIAVHAFEPYPPIYDRLGENLALNRRGRAVRALPLAVSDAPGEADLYIPSDEHGLLETSCSLNEKSRLSFASAVRVPVVTLDAHLARHREPVVVVKVDVEAFDDRVLAGADATVQRHRPVVFYEQLHQGHAAPIDELRRRWGYTSAALGPDGLRVEEQVSYHEDAWNHVMRPTERTDAFLDRCLRVGVRPA